MYRSTIRSTESCSERESREQQRVAQLLHDSVCQGLGALHLRTQLLARRLKSISPQHAEEAASIARLIDQIAEEVDDVARRLRPIEIEGSELESELRNIASAAALTLPCTFDSCAPNAFSTEVARLFFQVARESVLEFQRHAGMEGITVAVSERSLEVRGRGTQDPELLKEKSAAWRAFLNEYAQDLGARVECAVDGREIAIRCVLSA